MFQPVIKWSGSKRSQAQTLISHFPSNIGTYFEPFVGGGAVLYAFSQKNAEGGNQPEKDASTMHWSKKDTTCNKIWPKKNAVYSETWPQINAVCSDICSPLIELWKKIRDFPQELADAYRQHWHNLQQHGHGYYYQIRSEFNQNEEPEKFLFLSRTCINGLIRFNRQGKFNSSIHLTRKGIQPDRLEKIIFDWSKRIKDTQFVVSDYRNMIDLMKENDFVYLDPPYFHSKTLYYGNIDPENLFTFLENLNQKGIKFLLSYDGKRGEDDFSVDIPKELYKTRGFISSGNSPWQIIDQKQKKEVLESFYKNY